MNLSPAQIAEYAAAAGFTGNDLVTAVAIALAESGGNSSNYNKEPQDVPGKFNRSSSSDGRGSYGLWQIYLAAHPEFAGANLMDPQTNAAAAYSLYAVEGFHPWSTYTSGEYGMYETPAMLAQVQPPAPAPLILDAATGQPVTDTAPPPMYAAVDPSLLMPAPSTPSFGTVALWALLGVAALWLFNET
jgi:hypothetical protein